MHNKPQFATPNVPISWGELLDKITILEIKERNIENTVALQNVRHELNKLRDIAAAVLDKVPAVRDMKSALNVVNQKLWIVEDDLRLIEETKEFGDRFVQLARSVYQLNDQRAKIKKEMNLLLSSELVEEKSYKGFSQ